MSDLDAGVTLTPEENAYFESGGNTPPNPEPAEKPEGGQPEEGKDKAPTKEQESEKVEKVVPLAALHEERGKRKSLEQQLQQLREENARFSERFKIVEELNKKQEPTPDPATDPVAYLQRVPGELDSLRQKVSTYEEQQQAQHQYQQAVTLYSRDADRFRQETPDFNDAYKFIVESRVREYELIGHQNPLQAAQADEFQIVLASLQQSKSPAEVIYNLAKARGYQVKAPAKPDKSAAEKLETIEKGQAANKSLASAGGASGAEEMTAEALLKMPMDEFEKWVEKNPAKAKRLMGG